MILFFFAVALPLLFGVLLLLVMAAGPLIMVGLAVAGAAYTIAEAFSRDKPAALQQESEQ